MSTSTDLPGRTTSPAPLDSVVASARAAAPGWRSVPPAERGELVRCVSEKLASRADEIAVLNTHETGKLVDDSRGGVEAGIGTLRQYAELGPLHRGRALRGSADAIDYTVAHPRGVVAAVTPWNDPVAIACGLVGAALVTGNVVVHKPSERCPGLGRLLGEVLQAALPPGVLQTLDGGPDVGARLVAHPGVDVVAHVGSTRTGLEIERAALDTGAHVVRENGGNDALVVDADVDPTWAAGQAALGAFANGGQICTSVERIYVHHGVAEPFVRQLVAEAEALTASDRLTPLVDGAMRDAVHAQVSAAVRTGARLLSGGTLPGDGGTRYPATVLGGVGDDMAVMREETFGPVAPVRVVDDFAEGLRLAADDRYGLAATVLTHDMAHAQRAAAELPVGTVKINAVFGGAPGGSAQPRGASGRGYGYGPELLDEMTTTTVVHIAAPR
jgi:betaine-aldehyde dehydrogenase